MFDMYSGMYDSCALAARQQWGSQGIFIPETVAFDGLAKLPDDIAAEMRDLYLLRKPWDQRSEKFRAYAGTKLGFSSRWNWLGGGKWENGRWAYTERGGGPYGPVTHIFSREAKIAYLYWQRYEYSMDTAWLRDRAYPMLKGVAEFYRNYPNVKKEADGKYHIHHVNSNEPVWGGQDTDEELSSMYAILPVAIRASELLSVDADLRPAWRELLDHLAPLPHSQGQSPTWVKALDPVVKGNASSLPDGNTMPMWVFDLCTLENTDPETMKIANATYDAYFRSGVSDKTRVGVLSKLGVTAAMMGRADHVRYLLPNQINSLESAGPGQSHGPARGPADDERPAAGPGRRCAAQCPLPEHPRRTGPGAGHSRFPRLAQGMGCGVHSIGPRRIPSQLVHDGRQDRVRSNPSHRSAAQCRLRNPWPDTTVTLYRNGTKTEDLSGSLLTFPTAKGETVSVVVKGMKVTRKEVLQ